MYLPPVGQFPWQCALPTHRSYSKYKARYAALHTTQDCGAVFAGRAADMGFTNAVAEVCTSERGIWSDWQHWDRV